MRQGVSTGMAGGQTDLVGGESGVGGMQQGEGVRVACFACNDDLPQVACSCHVQAAAHLRQGQGDVRQALFEGSSRCLCTLAIPACTVQLDSLLVEYAMR